MSNCAKSSSSGCIIVWHALAYKSMAIVVFCVLSILLTHFIVKSLFPQALINSFGLYYYFAW